MEMLDATETLGRAARLLASRGADRLLVYTSMGTGTISTRDIESATRAGEDPERTAVAEHMTWTPPEPAHPLAGSAAEG